MKTGEVSSSVRIGEWYHLIKVERVLEPEDRVFAQVRGELEQSLYDRVADAGMFGLFEKLFEQATIRIDDPTLRAAFDKKHPGRGR